MKDLMGLVLCGGRSTRMGSDKSLLTIDGIPLFQRAVDLLRPFTDEVFISCRAEQEKNYAAISCLIDRYEDIGPIGGIATAMETYPQSAFLVFAVDLVAMNSDTVECLISHRDESKDMTCYQNEDGSYEPLCAIYEPITVSAISESITREQYSLQKLIQKSRVCILPVSEAEVWQNWNK